MSIVVRFVPQALTKAKYDEVSAKCEEELEWPPDGLEFHACFGTDGDLRVSEVWSSREQFEAFGQHIMPLLEANGVELAGEPEVFEVHNVEYRQLQGQ